MFILESILDIQNLDQPHNFEISNPIDLNFGSSSGDLDSTRKTKFGDLSRSLKSISEVGQIIDFEITSIDQLSMFISSSFLSTDNISKTKKSVRRSFMRAPPCI
jgi:hypothetical protein